MKVISSDPRIATNHRRTEEDRPASHITKHPKSTNQLFYLCEISVRIVAEVVILIDSTIAISAQDFRSEIFWRATERVGLFICFHIQLAETKVTQRNVTSVIKKDVLRF